MSHVIVWFRKDLRLRDNPALTEAIKTGFKIIPLYILDETPFVRPLGGASKWWLHESLKSLNASLETKGSQLLLKKAPALEVLKDISKTCEVKAVFWNRCYEPDAIQRDQEIKAFFPHARSFRGNLLEEPFDAPKPYKVYTPFWKAFLGKDLRFDILEEPKNLKPHNIQWGDTLENLDLAPKNWGGRFKDFWTPGEKGAFQKFDLFLKEKINYYHKMRDFADQDGCSRLSPHLAFGEISVREIYHILQNTVPNELSASKFLSELGWRDFSAHLLYHNPQMVHKNLNSKFDQFPWVWNSPFLEKWKRGETGYDIVDAGMNELWQTGYMHNRVRMITASFLVKDLLVHWKAGEEWFWDTLVDADLANNIASWQWVSGCGADAAPFFRVFNPLLQQEKFDPKGLYVQKWLKKKSPPIVDHSDARKKALELFKSL